MAQKKEITAIVAKIYEQICKIEIIICGGLFLVIVFLVFISAMLRKFNCPIQWSIDVSQLCFAWLAFLGGDVALRKGSLIGVALVTGKLNKKMQQIIKNICYLLMIVLLAVFIRYGFPLAIHNWDRAFQTLPISYGFVTISLPISSILMICSIFHNLILENTQIEKESSICGCY
jgi:TRAP-type C4-dicarboxylate transport system permease small subunit